MTVACGRRCVAEGGFCRNMVLDLCVTQVVIWYPARNWFGCEDVYDSVAEIVIACFRGL